MPLNDYPSAKPTYDFSITTERGKTAIANGERVRDNPPSREFPQGSTTTVWHAPTPIASYLVQTTVGDYNETLNTVDGLRYYAFQNRAISVKQRVLNAKLIATQPAMTRLEEHVAGAFPFPSDGIVVGGPSTTGSSEEEMQGMIANPGTRVSGSLLAHENFHQWFGDNVSEANFQMAFFKEGMATLAQEVYDAEQASPKTRGLSTPLGRAEINQQLVREFNGSYAVGPGAWQIAPSRRAPADYDSYADIFAVYTRPANALIALRQILGSARFDASLQAIQRRYRGSSITEREAEAAFAVRLPDRSGACRARLSRFFTQWFGTAYHGAKPQITGPGLHGQSLYANGCTAPNHR
jgi:aminopeptidase N